MRTGLPSFAVTHTDGVARCGTLSTSGGTINTPASLLYTRRGASLSMTPDILDKLHPHRPQAVQVDILQFLMGPSPETLSSSKLAAHSYLAFPPNLPILASNRDPTLYEYGAKPSTDSGAYALIHSGGILATPEKYMAAVEALQPDLYVTLCDEVTADVSNKRLLSSIDRTNKWTDTCLAHQSKSKALEKCGALAAVGGGACVKQRAKAAQNAAAKSQVSGFALCGFSTGENPAERPDLLAAAISKLPSDKPRFLSGMGEPTEVLDAISQGVDLFDTAYVSQVTQAGYALCFPCSPPSSSSSSSSPPSPPTLESSVSEVVPGGPPPGGMDMIKFSLWSTLFRLDKGPLLSGCSCYTCTRHSRAYLHHLLQSNEMLAEVLLEIHNTYHYENFMAAVRGAVQDGNFEDYMKWWKTMRQVPLTGSDDLKKAVKRKYTEVAEEGSGKERGVGGVEPGSGRGEVGKRVAM